MVSERRFRGVLEILTVDRKTLIPFRLHRAYSSKIWVFFTSSLAEREYIESKVIVIGLVNNRKHGKKTETNFALPIKPGNTSTFL